MPNRTFSLICTVFLFAVVLLHLRDANAKSLLKFQGKYSCYFDYQWENQPLALHSFSFSKLAAYFGFRLLYTGYKWDEFKFAAGSCWHETREPVRRSVHNFDFWAPVRIFAFWQMNQPKFACIYGSELVYSFGQLLPLGIQILAEKWKLTFINKNVDVKASGMKISTHSEVVHQYKVILKIEGLRSRQERTAWTFCFVSYGNLFIEL